MTVPNFTAGQVLTAAELDALRSALGMTIPDFVAGQVLTAAELNQLVAVANNPIYGTATGGVGAPVAVTIGGVDYEYLTFTSSGTLTITKAGLFDVLMFAGGGCGGTGATNGAVGGGAGAGGVLEETIFLDASVTVTIGAGGATGTPWTEGSSSTVGNAARNLSVAGGGKGGGYLTGLASIQGSMGGSGGGGVSANVGQGFANIANPSMAPGISGHSGAANNGGGGGATANASTTTGGTGYDVSAFIGGSALIKATGGNGNTVANTNGAANSADGGGGGPTGNNTGYGSGGSGIVYIRFKV